MNQNKHSVNSACFFGPCRVAKYNVILQYTIMQILKIRHVAHYSIIHAISLGWKSKFSYNLK